MRSPRARLPPRTLTVIVPRHPQRFDAVAALLRQRGIPFVRRSDNAPVPADVDVVLGDSMGEMAGYYAAADVAFVGGSLLPLGGQNLIEPIAAGRRRSSARTCSISPKRRQKALAAGAARRGRRCRRADREVARAARATRARRAHARGRARLPRGAPRRRGPAVGVARAAPRAAIASGAPRTRAVSP